MTLVYNKDRILTFHENSRLFAAGTTSQFAWSLMDGTRPFNYICEIPRKEVYRLIQQDRGFGMDRFMQIKFHVGKLQFWNDLNQWKAF